MKRVLIKNILKDESKESEVKVAGWVRTVRNSKTFSFIEINDGSCLVNLQIIADSSLRNYAGEIDALTTGSSLTVEGKIVASQGKDQTIEIHAANVKVHNIASSEYPLQKKRHNFEFLREIAHLRPRTNTIGAVARIRSSLSFAVHRFFHDRDFKYVHTPLITTSDCEGAGEMFKVTTLDLESVPKNDEGKVDFSLDFFGKAANLTVSGQLNGETYATALDRIYTFGPTFRAENSHTSRHLAEFWMIEPEAAFFDLENDMDLAEDFVKYLAQWVLENDLEDLQFFAQRIEKTVIEVLQNIVSNSFERISYTDAVAILEKNNDKFQYPVKWGVNIQTEHERYLTEEIYKKPVIVYNYPKDIKAFYMKQNDDGKTVRAMDLLVPRIGELIGGSEREDDYNVLLCRIKELGFEEKDYSWYLDLRKYGSVPHAGFGLGFERMLLLVTGMDNIRDVIPFPRYSGNADF